MKPDKALELALDAAATDTKKAAKKHKRTQRSIQHAVKQVLADPVLSLSFAEKRKQLAQQLHDDRVGFLKSALASMLGRVPTMEDRDLVGAYKIIADHHEVALGVTDHGGQHHTSAQPNTPVEEVASGAGDQSNGGWLSAAHAIAASRPQ